MTYPSNNPLAPPTEPVGIALYCPPMNAKIVAQALGRIFVKRPAQGLMSRVGGALGWLWETDGGIFVRSWGGCLVMFVSLLLLPNVGLQAGLTLMGLGAASFTTVAGQFVVWSGRQIKEVVLDEVIKIRREQGYNTEDEQKGKDK